MVKFSILAILVLGIGGSGVFSAFLSDGVKLVHFQRDDNETDSFNFEYQTDENEKFCGKTVSLVKDEPDIYIHLIFGPDNVVYWVDFTKYELEHQERLSKMIRLVQRDEDTVTMKDDFVEYILTLSAAFMIARPYQTTWDLDGICFSKSDDDQQTFNYTISATNNSRKYNGTTYLEADDPLVQLIHLDDGSQRDDVYQVVFTPEELNSNDTFCRGITKTISQTQILAARPVSNIDPNALKSLIGNKQTHNIQFLADRYKASSFLLMQ